MNNRSTQIIVLVALVLAPATAFAGEGGNGFDAVHWAASMVNFAIFMGVLVWFAGPKIQGYFATRADSLRSNIEEAKKLRIEAQKKLDEYSARLEKLDDEREALMHEYHKQGEREKERLVADATRQVEKLRIDAELIIQQEVRKAIAGIERQAVDLAVNLARTSLTSKLDERTQNKLVDAYVDDLKSLEG